MYRQLGKNLLNSNISTCPTIWRTSAHWRLRSFREFGAPQQIVTGFASCLRYCSDVAHQRPTKLCMIFGHFLGWYSISFLGAVDPWQNIASAKFSLRPSLAFAYIGSVNARHSSPAAGASQTLRRGTRNVMMQLSQRAPPIFHRAAITLASAHILVFFCISPILLSSSQ